MYQPYQDDSDHQTPTRAQMFASSTNLIGPAGHLAMISLESEDCEKIQSLFLFSLTQE